MKLLSTLRRLVLGAPRTEIDQELEQHLALLMQENIAAGMTADEARAVALRRFGNVTKLTQECRAEQPAIRFEAFREDLRYGWRLFLKNPGFSALAVLTLALGIGTNASIFSLINSVLLRPLPLPEAHRLVFVNESENYGASIANIYEFRKAKSLHSLTAWSGQSVNITGQGEPERVIGAFVNANFTDVFGVAPAQGRTFRTGEDEPGAPGVAIISHGLWQAKFGGAPVLDRVVTLNGQPFTVIGVMPQGFRPPIGDYEVWLPLWAYPNYNLDPAARFSGAFGRLAQGVSEKQAQAELTAIAAQIKLQYPNKDIPGVAVVSNMQDRLVDGLQLQLWVLLGAAGLVLLIACANVANLLLARGSVRQRELVVRAALGAGRGRIVRQLLTEAALLAGIGSVAGLAFAYWGIQLLLTIAQGQIPSYTTVALDGRVVAFAIGLAVATIAVFGIVPAMQLSRPNLNEVMNEAGRTPMSSRTRHRMRSVLVMSQVALAVVLLVGTGLLTRTLARLSGVDVGFDTNNLLTLEYRLPKTKYTTPEQTWNFHRQVVEKVAQVPGVEGAAIIRALPFSGNGGAFPISIVGKPEPKPDEQLRPFANSVTPTTFSVMRVPLLRGRGITEADTANSMPVVVINQKFAERGWPGEDPLGQRIAVNIPSEGSKEFTVVGVVGNINHYQLDEQPPMHVYTAYAQDPFIFATLVARTKGDPMLLANSVRQAVWSVDKDQPVWKIRTQESLLDRSKGGRRLFLQLIGSFAALALLLSVIGIYAVVAWMVTQRTHEIGVRMALGARSLDVLKMVLRHSLWMALIGVAVGTLAAVGATQVLKNLLFGVENYDPVTLVVVALTLLSVALLAGFVPARRAMKVDPTIALRYE